jgi:hypothetical protein
MIKSLHTLNARENIFLSVAKEHFNLTSERVRSEIVAMLDQCRKALSSKNIEYQDLRCPSPQNRRHFSGDFLIF